MVPLLVISYLAYLNGIKTIKQDTFDRLASINALKADEVSRWINSSRSHLQALAQRPLVRLYTSQLLDNLRPENEKKGILNNLLYNHFDPSISYDTGFIDLSLINSDEGKIIASTNTLMIGKFRKNRMFFIKGKQGTYVDSMAYEVGLEQLVMHISTPIKNEDGQTLAVLSGHLDWQELTYIMKQGRGRSMTEESYLVNQFNYFVTESRFIEDAQLQKTIHTLGVERCLMGEEGVEQYNDYRSQPIIGAFRWMEEWNLCILTEEDRSEAFKPMENFKTVIIIVGIISAVLAVLFSLVFARTITKKISRLGKGAKEIGKGNLLHRLEVSGNDEIDQLANSFNQMAQERQLAENNLQSAHNRLEEKVAKRTTQISQKNLKLKEEIKNRTLMENSLRESENRYRSLVETQTDLVSRFTPEGKFTFVNEVFCKFFNKTKKELLGGEWQPLPVEEDIEHVYSQLALLSEENPTVIIENRVYSDKGDIAWMQFVNKGFFDTSGNLLEIQSVGRNITDRKRAEEKVKTSLNEKEVLIKEIHHRVKNNMQIIQSLLSLQISEIKDSAFKKPLIESNNRIKSMALIHETLYKSKDMVNLDVESYFNDITQHLLMIYQKQDVDVNLKINIDSAEMDMDICIACGLILNELVSNTLKYAFKSNATGKLSIILKKTDKKQGRLTIRDSGCGLPTGFNIEETETLGLKIVSILVKGQLKGSINLNNDNGASFDIKFPLKKG